MLKHIGNYLKSKWSIRLLFVFYLLAGFNHFINPTFYLPLIPPYLPYPEIINWISGVIEIVVAFGVLISKSRKIASFVILAMLIAFIPSHVYFIQTGSCVDDGLCVPQWIGWLRLIIIHPLLLLWAWKAGTSLK
ncbi:Uncharacterized membrane protein [Marivirga sericea]|uniref:Uncharacterized membrane protein n=1 Tax=Marivirga sericea TaxID=1028 RepID=A0A1X7IC59_9BACT|nr:hypothetical protein [Marivirga sericea]SMG12218.1 Uncharacterized membrane protein [Marivirga sericea]